MTHYAGTRGFRRGDKPPKKVRPGGQKTKAKEKNTATPRFRGGQSVWPVLCCNGKEKLGQGGKVIGTVDGRVWVKFPHLKRPIDYNPISLSTKGP